ncbi:hypothetical protein F4775DRAFT_484624 [Biscogniauxia sp. FL1348]|nr:hypothetical protein F4775DRAFT_484624 [Biscogniauxia sp. FL1348]
MRLSSQGSVAAAMAATLVSAATSASPVDLSLPQNLDLSKPINAGLSLDVDISHTTLLAGVVAQAAVGDIAAVGADVNVAVVCQDCYVKGAVNASLSLENVVPALRLDLSDIEVKLDLDVHLDAGVTVAVRLPIPETHLSLPLPELDVGVSLYLELLVGAKTAIDVSAGVFVQLLQNAFLETNIIDGKILDASFEGLAVNVLPIEVRLGCTELLVDLKLRAEVAVEAEVELDEILPLEQLGLDVIPDIGAGIEVAAAVDLLEYVGLFCADASCPLGYESSGLSIAAAAKVDVEIEDILDVPIEINIGTKLLSLPTVSNCQPSYPTGAVPTLSASTPASGSGYPAVTSGNSPVTTPAPSGFTTTVVTGTQTFTATVCGERSANCPGGSGTTIVHTTVYTTTCPVGQTSPITGLPPAPTHETTPTVTITKHVTTMVPCSEVVTYGPPGSTPVVSVPPTAPVFSTTPIVSVPTTAPFVSTTAQTSPVTTPGLSTSVTVPATAPSFTPSTNTATVPGETPSESCSTTSPVVSVPTTAPVFSTSTVPAYLGYSTQ